jgi:hypothetical protein
MSKATVFSSAQYGLADESSATGLYIASVTFSGSSDLAEVPDHIGCTVGMSVYNPRKEVSADGVIKTKGAGLSGSIGTVISLANTTNNTRTRLTEALNVTAESGAAIVMTGNDISPKQSGFEEGSMNGVYFPFVVTTSPTSLT